MRKTGRTILVQHADSNVKTQLHSQQIMAIFPQGTYRTFQWHPKYFRIRKILQTADSRPSNFHNNTSFDQQDSTLTAALPTAHQPVGEPAGSRGKIVDLCRQSSRCRLRPQVARPLAQVQPNGEAQRVEE